MLRAGNAVRFVPSEVEDYRSLGIDFAGARTQDDVEQALGRWAQTLANERPDLLDKIVQAMAEAKSVRPPSALTWWSTNRLLPVLSGNADPAVGDLVQVDQVALLDLTRLAQSGDHLLDQFRVVLGELNRHGRRALSVVADQHGSGFRRTGLSARSAALASA